MRGYVPCQNQKCKALIHASTRMYSKPCKHCGVVQSPDSVKKRGRPKKIAVTIGAVTTKMHGTSIKPTAHRSSPFDTDSVKEVVSIGKRIGYDNLASLAGLFI